MKILRFSFCYGIVYYTEFQYVILMFSSVDGETILVFWEAALMFSYSRTSSFLFKFFRFLNLLSFSFYLSSLCLINYLIKVPRNATKYKKLSLFNGSNLISHFYLLIGLSSNYFYNTYLESSREVAI